MPLPDSNIISIKRRLSGLPGAPDYLSAAELAYNQVDETLYYGSSSLDTHLVTPQAIAGPGAFVTLATTQSVSGNKTFSGTLTFSGTVNAYTTTFLVSSVPSEDKTNKAASTEFVHSLVDSINTSLSNGVVDTSTTQEISGNKTFKGNTTLAGASLSGAKITNLGTPEAPYDAVNKKYVDAIASSLNVHEAVKAATTVELLTSTYTNTGNGLYATLVWETGTGSIGSYAVAAIDGVDLYIGDRVLIKDQTNAIQNGVYAVSAFNVGLPGNITFQRTPDYNQSIADTVRAGDFLFVTHGATHINTGFVQTATGPITIGTSNITFTQFSGTGSILAGTGITIDGDTIKLTNVGTAGNYLSVTTNEQGQVTSGHSPDSLVGLSAVSMSSRRLPLYTSTNTVCAVELSNYGESLIKAADATGASTILNLKSMAVQAASAVDITGGTLTGVVLSQTVIDCGTF
jgi:hypothetical protein